MIPSRFFALSIAALVAVPALASSSRSVTGNVLTSPELPPIRITVDPAFKYVGSFPFKIRDIAAGERHVFVDAKEGRVLRTVIAQFESFLPESGEIYRYDFSKAMDWNGFRFRDNTFAFSDPEYARENPGNESMLTASFLRGKGYVVPDEWMVARFVTLGDESRKHELILFYEEDPAAAGRKIGDFYVDDQPTDVWKKLREDLRARALKTVSVSPLE